MLSVQHGRSNPYVRGPVLLLCPHGKSVKLCTSISLGEGQLCRVCLQRHRLNHSRPTTNQGTLATCCMTQTAARSQNSDMDAVLYLVSEVLLAVRGKENTGCTLSLYL